MAQVTVDYSVRLQVLQSSVDNLQKVLDKLEPNSAGFNRLNKVIQAMRREMEDFQVQTSKAFSSQQQFNKAEKTLDKIGDDLVRAQNAVDSLKFKDIKLTDDQLNSFKALDDELQKVNSTVEKVKKNFRDKILGKDNNKSIIQSIDPNLITKDLDVIINKVNKAIEKANKDFYTAQQKFSSLDSTNQRASLLTQTGINKESLGESFFNRFFEETTSGAIRFIRHGFGKGEVKKQFLQALKDEFRLEQKDIDELINSMGGKDTFKDFNQAFLNMGAGTVTNIFGDSWKNQMFFDLAKLRKDKEEAEKYLNDLKNTYNQFSAGMSRDTEGRGIGEVSIAIDIQTEKVAKLNQEYRNLETTVIRQMQKDQELAASKERISNTINNLRTDLDRVNTTFMRAQEVQTAFTSVRTAITNFMGFNQVLNLTRTAVREAMNHIKQLDETMNGIAIVTDMTTEDLWKQIDTYSKVAQTYGTTIQGAYEVSKIYYQAGYETNDVLSLMNETLKLSKVSGLDYAKATDYMMTATRGFHMEVSEASRVVDVYSALAANTAISQEELAVAMSKTASSMESVGSTFEETSAMISTMVAVTRESATNIGSAMKSIASRYGELTKDPKALYDSEGDEMSFNKVDEALKSVGISLQTANHQFRDFTDVILELSDAWGTLDSAQQRYIATQFAGNRQQSRFLALVSNADLIRENIKVAEESEDTGTLQALKALDSLESKLNQVQVAYQQFYTSVGAEQLWKSTLGWIKNFIDSLNSLPKVFNIIPLNAGTVIYDTITLLKKGMTEAFVTIIKQIQNSGLLEAWENKGRQEAEAHKEGVVDGIRQNAPQIQEALQEGMNPPVAQANQVTEGEKQQIASYFESKKTYWKEKAEEYRQEIEKVQQELAETETGATIRTFALTNKQFGTQGYRVGLQQMKEALQETLEMSNYTKGAFEKLDIAVQRALNADSAKEFNRAMVDVVNATEGMDQSKLENIRNTLNDLTSSAKNADVLSGVFERMGNFASFAGERIASITNAIKKNNSQLNDFSMALNIVANAINKSDRAGQMFAGSLMTIAGAVRAITAVFKEGGISWLGLAMGAIGIINGIATAYETAEEKIERLSKEAEKLNNEAKKVKADYNTIQRTADKIDELKAKRYESIEAEQEYQTAVEELAEKVPSLIVGLDDAGNVIVDTANLEYELEKAREAAAEATLKAAQAEREKAQVDLENAKKQQNKLHEEIINSSDITVSSWQAMYSSNSNIWGLPNDKDIQKQWAKLTQGYYTGQGAYYDVIQSLNSIFKQRGIDNTGLGSDEFGRLDIINIQDFLTALDSISEITEEYNQLIESFKNGLGDIEIRKHYDEINMEIAALNDNNNKTEEELKNEIINIKELISKYQLWGDYGSFIKIADEYITGIKTIQELEEALGSTQTKEISAAIQGLEKAETDFLKNKEGRNILATSWIQKQAEVYAYDNGNYTTDSDDYKQRFEKYLKYNLKEDFNNFKNSLTEAQWKLLDDNWDKLDSYSIGDLAELLNIKEEDPFLAVLNDYYIKYRPLERIKENLNSKMAHIIGKEDSNSFDTLSGVSKDMESFISNGLDLYGEYFKEGYSSIGQTFLDNIFKVTEAQQNVGIKSRSTVADILEDMSYTREGIQKVIDQLKDVEGTEKVQQALITLRDSMLNNLPLSIQTAIEEISSSVDETVDSITKAYKGFSKFSDAKAYIDKLNALAGEELYSLNDVKWNGSKYTISKKIQQEGIKLEKELVDKKVADINSMITTGLEEASKGNQQMYVRAIETGVGKLPEVFSKSTTQLNEILKSAGLITINEETNEFTLSEDFKKAIKEAGDSFNLIKYLKKRLEEQLKDLNAAKKSIENNEESLKNENKAEAYNALNELNSKFFEGFKTSIDLEKYIKELGINLKEGQDYSYDEALEQWSLTTLGYLRIRKKIIKDILSQGGTKKDVDRVLEQLSNSLLENIDVSGYLSSNKTAKDKATLRQAYESWYQSLTDTTGKLTTDAFMAAIEAGGEETVKAAEQIAKDRGEKLSTSDVENIYRSEEVKKLLEAGEQLDKNIGDIIDSKAKEILEAAGYYTDKLSDNSYIITSLGNVETAYNLYFDELIENAQATAIEIDEARKSIINAHNDKKEKNKEFIDNLSDLEIGMYTNIASEMERIGINPVATSRDYFNKNFLPENYNGNIDLFRRLRVPIEDSYGTIFSFWEDINGIAATFASITQDGILLSDQEINNYIDDLRDSGAKTEAEIKAYDAQHLNLFIGIGEDLGEYVHNLQEEWDNVVFNGKDISSKEMSKYEAFHNLEDNLAKVGAYIEDGILKTTENSDPLGINKAFEKYYQSLVDTAESEEFKSQNEKFLVQVKDSIEDFIYNYIELINNGISGELSNTQALDLEKFANDYGLKIDFTKTAEGLKLSEKSARDLYLALREVDSVRAKLVFDKLAESLEKTNSNYKDISTITARIVELEKQIASTPVSDARRKEYEKELEVAKEIQETRSLTDTGNFNFMERDLPTGMQNPIDYWQGVYQWYESMNKAGEDGYIKVQDFYNGVQEATNLAKISGQSIYYAGEWLDGSAEKASELIQKGMNSISNIDGVGPAVDLKRFGISFKNGAADMSKNVDDGVKSMAKSQIEMLDAMIAFLETIVAMDKFNELDKDDDGLDFFEVFEAVGDNVYQASGEAQQTAGNILKLADSNKDLNDGLHQVKIDGVSAYKIMQDINAGAKLTEDEALKYYKTLSVMAKAARDGDFSTENLTSLIQEAFKDVEELTTVEIGDRKFAIKGDTVLEMDKDGSYVVDGQHYKSADTALKAQKFKQEHELDSVIVEGSKVRGKKKFSDKVDIEYERELNDENATPTWIIGGTSYSDKKAAIEALYKLETGKDRQQGQDDDFNTWFYKSNARAEFDITLTEAQTKITDTDLTNLSEKALEAAGVDMALVAGIQVAINKALTNVNLGQLILDGLLEPSDKEAIALNEEEIGTNPKLIELGRQLGIGIVSAIQNGISEANSGNEENGVGGITDSVVQGLEDGKADVEEAAGHVADSAATPFKELIDPSSSDSFKIWGMSAVEQFMDGFNIVDSNGTSNFAEIFGSSFLSSIREVLTGQEMYNAGQAAADMFTQGFGAIGGGEGEQTSTIAQRITDPIRTAIQDLFSKETLDQLVKDFETNSTIALSFDHIDVGKLTEAATNVETSIDIVVNALNDLKVALDNLPNKSSEVQNTATAMNNLRDKSNEVNNTANAINRLQSKDIHVSIRVTDNGGGWYTSYSGNAKGNVVIDNIALAKGNTKKTLMGELGPELVVSRGRYYIVGQNGAEMVDLPNDAIVFNHLQTKQLLTSGYSSRGKAYTNERNAVSYATGNVTGPAMASASEVLATLKEIRAMWQSMLTASAKQLGSQAGISANKTNTGKDSNGNDKGDTVTAEDGTKIKTTTAEIQRWYNLLRQIDKTEKDIAYQEKLQTQYQSLRVADGKSLYKSYKAELAMLEQQVARSEELAELQKSWYDTKRAELAASAYGKIFRYTEDGLQQYVDGANKGLDILEKLTEADIWGNPTGYAKTVETQLSYLQSLGFDLNDLLSNSDGTKVASYVGGINYILDENGNRLEDQNLINAQVSIMENFWSNIDGWRDELDGLYDSYREQLSNVIDNQNKQNDVMQKIVDNQIEVENTVYQALIDARQAIIDNAQKELDAYQKNSEDMIEGLNNALEKERQLYDNQQSSNELLKLQRQLAILQRSGGSTAQILNLQNQIATKQQDMYFDEKEQQIQALQEASDRQIEKMQEQIDLMTETLEYEKENGLLWKQVYDVMQRGPEDILAFITNNSADWASNSALQISQSIADLQTKIEVYVGSRDDNFLSYYNDISSDIHDIATAISDYKNNSLNYNNDVVSSPVETSSRPIPVFLSNNVSNSNNDSYNDSNNYNSYNTPNNYNDTATLNEGSTTTYKMSSSGYFKSASKSIGHRGDEVTIIEENAGSLKDGRQVSLIEYKGKQYYIRNERLAYKNGGLIDFTGPAWVDGTPSEPEAILNAKETKFIQNNLPNLLSNVNTIQEKLEKLLIRQTSYLNNIPNIVNNSTNQNDSINIEHVQLNMTVEQMSNTADARKLGKEVLDELLNLSRKTGRNSVSRR